MRVKAPPGPETLPPLEALLALPVVVSPQVFESFQRQQDTGVSRWGAWLSGEHAVAAQPPPAPQRTGASSRAERAQTCGSLPALRADALRLFGPTAAPVGRVSADGTARATHAGAAVHKETT